MISIIAAADINGVIGYQNKIPWHCPEDLKIFKRLTMGKPIIMGRKTFESLGNKCLPGRTSYVLTTKGIKRNLSDKNEPVVCQSIDYCLSKIKENHPENTEIFVCGGQTIYSLFLFKNKVDKIYLNIIKKECQEHDTIFPNISLDNWKLLSQENHKDFISLILEKNTKCLKKSHTNLIFPFQI